MTTVTKPGLALLLLLVGAVGTSAQAGDPVSGEDVFAANCVRCHASPARVMRKIDGTVEEQSAQLDAFLADHHQPDPTDTADLIAYLVTL